MRMSRAHDRVPPPLAESETRALLRRLARTWERRAMVKRPELDREPLFDDSKDDFIRFAAFSRPTGGHAYPRPATKALGTTGLYATITPLDTGGKIVSGGQGILLSPERR